MVRLDVGPLYQPRRLYQPHWLYQQCLLSHLCWCVYIGCPGLLAHSARSSRPTQPSPSEPTVTHMLSCIADELSHLADTEERSALALKNTLQHHSLALSTSFANWVPSCPPHQVQQFRSHRAAMHRRTSRLETSLPLASSDIEVGTL